MWALVAMLVKHKSDWVTEINGQVFGTQKYNSPEDWIPRICFHFAKCMEGTKI